MTRQKFPERPAGPGEVVLDINDIHALCLRLLDLFTAYCDAHGLKYYLCGGTLLGAVRHGGFIPWDDDLDLFMARPDYQRLLQLMQRGEIAPGTMFACTENGRFCRPFARIYDLSAPVQRKNLVPASGPYAWIDILPVDGLPDDPRAIEKIYKRRYKLNRYNFGAYWKFWHGPRRLYKIRHLCAWIPGALLGPKFWSGRIDRLGKAVPYGSTGKVGCVTGGRYGPGEAMPLDAYEKPVTLSFEGRQLPAMSCWHEYLTGIFGDYMQLPPEDERWPHLNYVTMKKEDYAKLKAQFPALESKP